MSDDVISTGRELCYIVKDSNINLMVDCELL